jgi:hypothetical protein
MLLLAKVVVDYTKHFFLTRFNKINIQFYEALRLNMLKKLFLMRVNGENEGEENGSELKLKDF